MAKQKCTYKAEYFDFEEGKLVIFECENEAVQDGLCIFHHPTYWKKHKNKVRKEFYRIVNNAIRNRRTLKCIGFNIPEIDLSDKEFKSTLYFAGAIFRGKVNFRRTTFKGIVNFYKATFKGEANFQEAVFKEVNFWETIFKKRVNFEGSIFNGQTDFVGVVFKDEVNFKNVIFKGETNFWGAVFETGVLFWNIQFEKSASFYNTIFMGIADFWKIIFKMEADFNKAIFNGIAYFENITFKERADFIEAIFEGEAYFWGDSFEGETLFDNCKFFDVARFDSAEFLNKVSFYRTDFSPGFLSRIVNLWNFISFRYVYFKDQSKVIFDRVDMSRVSFLNADIDRVKFRNILNWGLLPTFDSLLLIIIHLKKERVKIFRNWINYLNKLLNNEIALKKELDRKFSILEERIKEISNEEIRTRLLDKLSKEKTNEINMIKEVIKRYKKGTLIESWKDTIKKVLFEFEEITPDNVLSVLRALRENYDYNLKYEESGKFFVSEMELKRKLATKVKVGIPAVADAVVLTLYKWLSLYGESFPRSIGWAIASILIFALLRWDIAIMKGALKPIIPLFLDKLRESTAIFFQLTWDTRTLTLAERLISIPILGSLYISLRRKLERRIRH